MRMRLGSRSWYTRSRRYGRAGWTRQNARLALAAAILVVFAILVSFTIYQLQTRQDADARGLTGGSVQTDKPTGARANAFLDTSSAAIDLTESVRLEVPLIMQLPELPTGCEATAVTMMLRYAGSSLTKFDVVDEMPYSSDPYEGFVGDPFTADGFTIYPQALMSLVYAQLGSAVDLTGAGLTDLQGFLQAGKPVCCWIADDQGYVHCVVITGYEDDTIYLNDPLEGSTTMSVSEFEHVWTNNARRALSY